MTSIRQAAVAGQFYPGNGPELSATIQRFLKDAARKAGPVPKAIIAPHAGYVYSGAVAASAYARIRPAAGRIRKVVLLGPCHRVPLRGLALSSAESFATPLGEVPIDAELARRIVDMPQVQIFDATHAQEHSLEVQLPFLQEILDEFTLLPLVVGEAAPEEVADVLDAVWGGPETLIVISSDLSHYENYETARQMDGATCRAIVDLDPARIGPYDACGRIPIGGLLTVAKRRGLAVSTVDMRSSGDTAGSHDRVVGYGSWVFVETRPRESEAAGEPSQRGQADVFAERTRQLLDRHGETLLHLAAASIEFGLRQARPLPVELSDYAPELGEKGASFVTLKREGRLRGCIGTSMAVQPLVRDVSDHAFAAAFRDHRFSPLTAPELTDLSLSVSVLSNPSPMTFRDEKDLLGQLRPHVDGLIIEDGGHRALFLPAVWETLPDAETFLGHLKVKAGLLAGHWSGHFKTWRFVAEEISNDTLPDPSVLWSLNNGN